MDTVYRLYTEDMNRKDVVRLTAEHFQSFTLQPTEGYYGGEPEPSIVLEIVEAEDDAIRQLARSIRRLNGQKSVLLLRLQGKAEKVQL
jgi:hypothetical protein